MKPISINKNKKQKLNPNLKIDNKNKNREEEGNEPMDTTDYLECLDEDSCLMDESTQAVPNKMTAQGAIVADLLSDKVNKHKVKYKKARIKLSRCDNKTRDDLTTALDPEINIPDNDSDLDVEEARAMLYDAKARAGRSRPPLGIDYYLKQVKRRKREEREEAEYQKSLEELFDRTTDIPELPCTQATERWLEVQEKKEEYFRTADTTEITATLTGEAHKLYSAVTRCKNIKGKLKGQMKSSTAIVATAIATLQQRAEAADIAGVVGEIAKKFRREQKAREGEMELRKKHEQIQELQRKHEQLQEQLEAIQMREHMRRGSPIPDSLGRREEEPWREDEKFWEERDESQKAPLPSKDGGALGDSIEGNVSLPLPPVDGGRLMGKREQRTLPLPNGREVQSSRKGSRDKGQDMDLGEKAKPANSGKTKPSPKEEEAPKNRVLSKVIENVTIVPPTNLSKEDQRIISDAERKITLMLEEVRNLQELVKEVRQKATSKQDARPKAKISDKVPQSRAEQQPAAEQQPEMRNVKKKKKKGSKTTTEEKTPMSNTSGKEKTEKKVVVAAPPTTAPPTTTEQPWSKIVERKEKKREKESKPSNNIKEKGQAKAVPGSPPVGGKNKKKKRKRPPKSEAVVLTCPNEAYADKLKEAREKISLDEIGIQDIKIKRGIDGAYIFEVAGEDKVAKANRLAAKLREEIKEVKITRPCKKSDLRIKNLDDSVSADEIKRVLANVGQCGVEGIHMGPIRRVPGGLGTAWAKCPLVAANKIAKTGKLRVGWSIARVEILPDRPLQCHKCLEGGHVEARCLNKADYSRRC